MLFNSYQFIFLFLPVTFGIYFLLNSRRLVLAGKAWLVVASLFFYAYWDVTYLPLILLLIAFNYAVGTILAQSLHAQRYPMVNRKAVLAFGIVVNLAILGYFKYRVFFVQNVNFAFSTSFIVPKVVLPLAISFFTFQKIAYLVDSYRGDAAEYDLLNYSLFVVFFPQLIAGPIVHHKEVIVQFTSRWTLVRRYRNILDGLFMFAVGLVKKASLADTFAQWANSGFDGGQQLNFYAAWVTSLSYALQLYFDFSGYCDMATGAAMMFNIRLPMNFNSPYKSLDIQDFWRRWHMTLSRFLRDYVYIPLGGSRSSELRTAVNLFATFLIGGLWHGASWMFVIWGALHGGALVVNRLWKKSGVQMPPAVAWGLTFLFVTIGWVFFRAATMPDAIRVLAGMADIRSAYDPLAYAATTADLAWGGWFSDLLLQWLPASLVGQIPALLSIGFGFGVVAGRNSFELREGEWNNRKVWTGALLLTVGICFTIGHTSNVFLYFNF
jgi:D-alanyl-lipoteichoic acid acyltransferase DltB (MBOAT superfamily)